MSVEYTYKDLPVTSAKVVRFSTYSGGERTLTITKSDKNGGRLLLDFGRDDDKMIVADGQVEEVIEALTSMAERGVAA